MTSPKHVLEALFEYVEAHITGPITLDQLESVCGLSRFALTRMLSRVAGVTPMDYVRGRRLARSLPRLIAGDNVLDVALTCGFEYEQSYIRAFKAAFGITPARFRKTGGEAPIQDIPKLSGFTVSASGMIGRPQLIIRPAFALRGYVSEYNYADNLLRGTPLADGVAACEGGEYLAAYRSRQTFVHQYLTQNELGDQVWEYPAGRWARFRYVGLHPLDAEGARRIRLMTVLVAGSWQSELPHRPPGAIERVDARVLSERYCEAEILFPLGGL